MITRRKELKIILNKELGIYNNIGYKGYLHYAITRCEIGLIWNYIKCLRKDEYYYNNYNYLGKKIFIIPYIFNRRRKNILGIKLGINIPPNTFDEGITIYHSGNIIVNKNAKIGRNCKLHGDNCIGNNGITEDAPVIGENVDIGVGAKIIGKVKIENGIKIGANAVVTKSFNNFNSTILGIPAKERTNCI